MSPPTTEPDEWTHMDEAPRDGSLWADYIAWALAVLGVATAIRIVDMLI